MAMWQTDRIHAVQEELPQCFHKAFEGIRYFNSVQTECFETAYLTNDNMVVGAPTGSGKTGVLELCILQMYKHLVSFDGKHFKRRPGTLKVVYICPLKALVQEKLQSWKNKFTDPLGLVCKELTSDADASTSDNWTNADIVLVTPEKFDAVTRRNKDKGAMAFFCEVALVLIDEVHLLSEPRGPALEAVVSRLKLISTLPDLSGTAISNLRLVACSATIPNAHDVAYWLDAKRVKTFGEEYRPVTLHTEVLGYQPSKNDFLFERKLNTYITKIVTDKCNGKPTLIFCSTRKGTSETAKKICDETQNFATNETEQAASHMSNKTLKQCVKNGIAFHNGGLSMQDRHAVERLFTSRLVSVVCTTSTLAQGINLPAHLVVIKGTRYYDDGMYHDFSTSSILQMIGRAGRPQHDTEGRAIIMTSNETRSSYVNLVNSSNDVTSQMDKTLAEHLNAEIAIRTVKSLKQAVEWVKTTFYWQRNKHTYKVEDGGIEMAVEKYVDRLTRLGMCRLSSSSGDITPEPAGEIFAKYYIRLETAEVMVNRINSGESHITDLLFIVAESYELSSIRLRKDEKKHLKALQNKVRYPLLEENKKAKVVRTSAQKIFLLSQERFSGSTQAENEDEKLPQSLMQDAEVIMKEALRISESQNEFTQTTKKLTATVNSFRLARAFRMQMWEGTQRETRQLNGVGPKISEKLAGGGITSLDAVFEADPRLLERLSGRAFPFGNTLQQQIKGIPKADIEIDVQAPNGASVVVSVTLRKIDCGARVNVNVSKGLLIAGTSEDDSMFICERVNFSTCLHQYTTSFKLGRPQGKNKVVKAAIMFSQVVGRDVMKQEAVPANPGSADNNVPSKRARTDTENLNGKVAHTETDTQREGKEGEVERGEECIVIDGKPGEGNEQASQMERGNFSGNKLDTDAIFKGLF